VPKVCVGGSFNILHAGHRKLLEAAVREANGAEVVVGLTSDRLSMKGYERPGFEARRRRVGGALKSLGCMRFSVRHLDSEYAPELAGRGESPSARGVSVIVVSEDTVRTAERLNRERRRNGLGALRIVPVPLVLAYDSIPIAARRVAAGEIDEMGRLRRPLKVAVGSTNPVKIAAVRDVAGRVFRGNRVLVYGIDPPRFKAQPWGEETKKGAVARAKAAMRSVGGSDYGVGVEAGVFEEMGLLMDVQWCAIVDKRGEVTMGHGPGFLYPDEMARHLRRGRSVSQATQSELGKRQIGRKEGAIGVLTKGHLDRKRLTESAVVAALAPRLHRMSDAVRVIG
jgi:inosine/xanthosine triphosphatase